MLDISKFVTVDDNGKPVIDNNAFQSAYDAELRKSLDTNSENTKKKLETEIRKQLEEEARLSAEEKLKIVKGYLDGKYSEGTEFKTFSVSKSVTSVGESPRMGGKGGANNEKNRKNISRDDYDNDNGIVTGIMWATREVG